MQGALGFNVDDLIEKRFSPDVRERLDAVRAVLGGPAPEGTATECGSTAQEATPTSAADQEGNDVPG